MPKFYKKYAKRVAPKRKFSVEQTAGNLTIAATSQLATVVVPATTTEGMRSVKHLTVSLASAEGLSGGAHTSWWALVYVPQGTTVNQLNFGGAGTTMYEPNQFVLTCGVADFSAGPVRITSPTSRNLNSGDAIYLICTNNLVNAVNINYVVRYAIGF